MYFSYGWFLLRCKTIWITGTCPTTIILLKQQRIAKRFSPKHSYYCFPISCTCCIWHSKSFRRLLPVIVTKCYQFIIYQILDRQLSSLTCTTFLESLHVSDEGYVIIPCHHSRRRDCIRRNTTIQLLPGSGTT